MLSQHVNAAMLYSDCDRISTDGVSRFQPEFKPDWSPAMLLSASYTEHLCAIRTSLLRELGGLLPERGDAVYWDLALRVAEHRVAVIHIPRVLYHVRTSANPSDGIDAGEAARIAIAEHLLRRGLDAQVQLTPTGNIRAVWPLRRQPHVSIVIPSRNLVILRRCIDSINERTAYSHFDFTVIDTTPDGELEKAYHDDNHVHVIRYMEPFNYSAVNNIAARQTHGEFLLFLNDDIEVIDTGWLEELLRWGELEEIGIVDAKLLRADRRIQHACVVLGMGGFAGHPFDGAQEGQQTIYGSVEWYRNYSAVTGACMLVRRAVFEQVGGFDEQFILCGSDVELCLRVREAGYQVVYTPFARLYHIESATRGAMIPSIDFALSYVHYQPLLSAGDPYYNPNLSLWSPEPRYRRRDEVDMLEHVHRSLEQLGVTQLVSTLMRERKQHRHKNQNGGSTYASNSRERDAAGT